MTQKKRLQDIQDIDLLYFFRLVMRYKWRILFFSFLITGLATYIVFQIKPVYSASTSIAIDKQSANSISISDVIPVNANRREYLATEIEILKSTELSERTVRRLSLDTHPLFDPRQQDNKFNLKTIVKNIFSSDKHALNSPKVDNEEIFDNVVYNFVKNLSVDSIRNTSIVVISYESTDPELAIIIADTMADIYIESHLQAKLDATTKTTNWLNDKLSVLRENLKSSEQALQNFRDEQGLIDVAGIKTIDAQQLNGLTQQYIEAKATRYNTETTYQQVLNLGATPSLNELMNLPSVLQQPLVQSMNNKKAQADQKVAELNQLLGSKHPDMVAAISEAKAANNALIQQVNRVVEGIKTNFQQARQTEASLQAQIEETKKRFQTLNKQEFKLDELEREVESNQQIYSLFLTRSKETDDTTQLRVPNARVIDFAKASRYPIKPKKALILALTFLISLSIFIFWVIIRDLIDKTFRTVYDIEDHLHMSVLGKIPLIKKIKFKSTKPFKGFMTDLDQDFTEAMRTIRTSFIVSNLDNPHKTSLITSSVPNEGKSTISLNFAEALGLMEKTLLIDVDLRRAELTKSLSIDISKPGLTDILTGKISASETILSISEHLDFIPAGTNLYYALEKISSNKMKELLNDLSKKYDRIILDTPPIHAVSDGIALAQLVDCVVFVIRAEETKINAAKRAIQTLLDMNANIAGVILNGVDKDKEKDYSGYDTGYGYGYDQQ